MPWLGLWKRNIYLVPVWSRIKHCVLSLTISLCYILSLTSYSYSTPYSHFSIYLFIHLVFSYLLLLLAFNPFRWLQCLIFRSVSFSHSYLTPNSHFSIYLFIYLLFMPFLFAFNPLRYLTLPQMLIISLSYILSLFSWSYSASNSEISIIYLYFYIFFHLFICFFFALPPCLHSVKQARLVASLCLPSISWAAHSFTDSLQ